MSGSNFTKTPKEIVQEAWDKHRANFKMFNINPKDRNSFIFFLNMESVPNSFWKFSIEADGSIRGINGVIPDNIIITEDMLRDHEIPEILNGNKNFSLSEINKLLSLDGENLAEIANISVEEFARVLPNEKLRSRLPRDGLIASELRRFDEAGLVHIRSLFNQDILKILGACDSLKWRDYKFYSEQEDVGDIRRKAASLFPLFANFMVERISVRRKIDDQAKEKQAFNEFINSEDYRKKLSTVEEKNGESKTLKEWMISDGRDPYAPWVMSEKKIRQAIQSAFGIMENGQPVIPMHVITNLRGVNWPTRGVDIEKIVIALSEIPPDWFPKNKNEWDAFCDLQATVTLHLQHMSGAVDQNGKEVPIPLKVLYEGCAGKWVEFRDRFMRAYSDQRPPEGTTEEDFNIIEKQTDWKGISLLPEEKRLAAAMEAISRMDGLSENCQREDLAKWIYRKITPDVSREALKIACLEVNDMLHSFMSKVLIPLACNNAKKESNRTEWFLAEQHRQVGRMAAAKILVNGKSAVRIMEMVRSYINRAAEISAAGIEVDDEKIKAEQEMRKKIYMANREMLIVGVNPNEEIGPEDWAPLFAVTKAPNDIYIVPLTSVSMLVDEGRSRSGSRLNHDGSLGLGICVGEKGMPYIENCRKRGEHVISFRKAGEDNGKPYVRLSCLQIAPIGPNTKQLEILQHRGEGNQAVPRESEIALAWLQMKLSKGEIKLNYEGVKSRLKLIGENQKYDEVGVMCGYNWKKENLIEKAMSPWASFVGKKYRKMSIDEFALSDEIQSIVNEFVPKLDFSKTTISNSPRGATGFSR